jgi:hypothetical protein
VKSGTELNVHNNCVLNAVTQTAHLSVTSIFMNMATVRNFDVCTLENLFLRTKSARNYYEFPVTINNVTHIYSCKL